MQNREAHQEQLEPFEPELRPDLRQVVSAESLTSTDPLIEDTEVLVVEEANLTPIEADSLASEPDVDDFKKVGEVAVHADAAREPIAQSKAARKSRPSRSGLMDSVIIPVRSGSGPRYDNAAGSELDTKRLMAKSAMRRPILTPYEEVILAKRVENGDKEARDEMVAANLQLVMAIARRFEGKGFGMEKADLYQEGVIGLIRAVDLFDYRMGNRFSTYATWWITESISRGIANTGRTIRLPVHIVTKVTSVNKVIKKLSKELARPPKDIEIAKELSWTVEEVGSIRDYDEFTSRITSLQKEVGDDDINRSTELGDILDVKAESVEDKVFKAQLQEVISEAVEEIPNNIQRRVLKMRLGLKGRTIMSGREVSEIISEELGKKVSHQRISKIKVEAQNELARILTDLDAEAFSDMV